MNLLDVFDLSGCDSLGMLGRLIIFILTVWKHESNDKINDSWNQITIFHFLVFILRTKLNK